MLRVLPSSVTPRTTPEFRRRALTFERRLETLRGAR
jgi:hypothetical protein